MIRSRSPLERGLVLTGRFVALVVLLRSARLCGGQDGWQPWGVVGVRHRRSSGKASSTRMGLGPGPTGAALLDARAC